MAALLTSCFSAVWTRFFPVVKKLQSLLHDEQVIGDVSAAFIDFGMHMPIGDKDPNVRTASRALGAGVLLDLGIYTLTWAALGLDASPKRKPNVEPTISSSMIFHSDTDPEKKVDEETAIILNYPDLKAQAVCTSSLLHRTPSEFARFAGPKGTVSVGGFACSKPGYLVVRANGQPEQKLEFEVQGKGFHYEADAVAEDIRSGRTENATCSWNETLKIMSRMDAVRAQNGLIYPQEE